MAFVTATNSKQRSAEPQQPKARMCPAWIEREGAEASPEVARSAWRWSPPLLRQERLSRCGRASQGSSGSADKSLAPSALGSRGGREEQTQKSLRLAPKHYTASSCVEKHRGISHFSFFPDVFLVLFIYLF